MQTNPSGRTACHVFPCTLALAVLSLPLLLATVPLASAQSCNPPLLPLPDSALRDRAVAIGKGVAFCESGYIYGTPPFSFQWLWNGAPISGASDPCYTITNVQRSDVGFYQLAVINACGTYMTTTNEANTPGFSGRLLVGAPPSLVEPLQDQFVAVGQSAVFSVNVTGDPPFYYQWAAGNGAIFVETSTCTVTNVQLTYEGPVRLYVGNIFGTNFYSANLFVATPPAITLQPLSQTVLVGSNVTLNVTSSGSNLHNSYQWLFYGTNLPGATNHDLVLSNIQPQSAGPYAAVASNPAGTAYSDPAQIDVVYAFLYADGQVLSGTNYSFTQPITLSIQPGFPGGSVFYTLDGSAPTFASYFYNGPFVLSSNALIRILTYSADFLQSGETVPVAVRVSVPFSLSATTPGGGTVGLSPPGGSYVPGATVQLTATPRMGWSFLGWLGDATGATNPLNVVVSRNKSVQAIFGTSLSTTAAGGGSVEVYPNGPVLPYGTIARLTAVPQAGNYFAVWGNAASGNVNPLYFKVTNTSPTVSSLFAALGQGQAALAMDINGLGSVTMNPRANFYSVGATVSISAVPEPGQLFLGWSGDATGTSNPLSLGIDQSKIIVANFSRKPVLLPYLSGPNWQASGFGLVLQGELGAEYDILTSPNLVDWSYASTVTNTCGTVQFLDRQSVGAPLKFYQAELK
jgi:hypothetical protein